MKAEQTTLLIVASCIFCLFLDTGCAGLAPRTERAELERNLSRQREGEGAPSSKSKISEPDLTPRFTVRAVRITGNVVLSAEELVENIPSIYREYDIDPVTGKERKDPATGKPMITGTYDFRAIADLIARLGALANQA